MIFCFEIHMVFCQFEIHIMLCFEKHMVLYFEMF